MRRLPSVTVLLTKAEFLNECAIPLNIGFLEIGEKVSSVADHLKKTAVGMVVMRVGFDMLVEVVDAGCQNGNLYLRRTGVALMGGIFFDDSLFFFLCHCNFTSL